MKIQFLGTGAADWPYFPAEEEEIKKSAGGYPLIRHTSSIMINDHILIDPAPSSFHYAVDILKLDPSVLTDIYLTHTHDDHWNPDTFLCWIEAAGGPVNFHYHVSAEKNWKSSLEGRKGKETGTAGNTADQAKVILCPMDREESHTSGEMVFTNLQANHYCLGVEDGSMYLMKEDSGQVWLYACDGGWFVTRTWDYLRNIRLNGVIIDGTVGEDDTNWRIGGHNTLAMNQLLRQTMIQQKMIRDESQYYLSHLGRTLYPADVDQVADMLSQKKFRMAWDGLVL